MIIIDPILRMVRGESRSQTVVCDLTAMGWIIILYDCLIQAQCYLKQLQCDLTAMGWVIILYDRLILIQPLCSQVVCDLTAIGWVIALYNRLLRLGRNRSREEEPDIDVQLDCIRRPSDFSEIVSRSSTSGSAKVCPSQGWLLSIQSR